MILRYTLLITLVLLSPGVCRKLIDSHDQSALQSSNRGATAQQDGSDLTSVPSFYHTQVEFTARLNEMAKTCKNIMTLETIDTGLGVVVAVIKAKESPKVEGGKKVAMLLFGEHAREVISSETALEFIADLCLLNPGSTEQLKRATAVLQMFDVYVVPNANPSGRAQVFEGSMCTRSNANGVDLNRNWGYQWVKTETTQGEMYGGPSPFSEPETRALKSLMDRIKPYAFITIHSGALGFYTPPGYSASPVPDPAKLINILNKVKEALPCQCHLGTIGKELGYVSHGNCLDYAHDIVHTRYAFAVEIFEQGVDSVEHGPCAASETTLCAHQYYHTAYDSARFRSAISRLDQPGKCFAFFNPMGEQEYRQTVAVWSERFMRMLCGTVENGKC